MVCCTNRASLVEIETRCGGDFRRYPCTLELGRAVQSVVSNFPCHPHKAFRSYGFGVGRRDLNRPGEITGIVALLVALYRERFVSAGALLGFRFDLGMLFQIDLELELSSAALESSSGDILAFDGLGYFR